MNEVERRFKPIDKQLNKYLKDYNKINKQTQDTLQTIFNELNIEYSDLNKKIPDSKKKRLDRRLEKLLGKKEDNYMYFVLKQALNKKNMTYRELLETYIVSAYYEERKELDEYDNMYFYESLETSYNQGVADIRKLRGKRHHIDEIFNWSILYTILNIPLLYGTKEAYLYALAMTNAEEMYKRIINNMQGSKELDIDSQDMQELLLKQRNRLISIKDGKYSGAIENMTESYCNLAYLQSGKDNDVRQCRFIARIDPVTTKMCKSLNNQLFYTDRMNVYQRYSDVDKKIVTYNTMGMVLGENLPPIMNHFHWCRSTITYLVDSYLENENNIIINPQKVKWKVINSNEYKKKIYQITNNDRVNESIYNVAKKIFNHRDKTNLEDLYYLNAKNGEIIGFQTNMRKSGEAHINSKMEKAIKENPNNIIAIHNHVTSLPPSDGDINSSFARNYKLGVELGFDGSIYTYNTKKMTQYISTNMYELKVAKYKKMMYNEAESQWYAMEELAKEYNFVLRKIDDE